MNELLRRLDVAINHSIEAGKRESGVDLYISNILEVLYYDCGIEEVSPSFQEYSARYWGSEKRWLKNSKREKV